MRAKANPFLLILAVLAFIPLALEGGLYLVLQTARARQIIRSTIAHSLGTPVSFSTISATLWGGIKVTSVSAEDQKIGTHLSIDSLILYPRYLKLLLGKVEIGCLQLQHPVALYTLSPLSKKSFPAAGTGQPSCNTTSSAATPPSQTIASQANGSTPEIMRSSQETIIQDPPHLKISDGEFSLLTLANFPVIEIKSLNLSECPFCDGALHGTITASAIIMRHSLIIHDLTSHITLSPEEHTLSLSNLTASLSEGKLSGIFSVLLPPEATSYQAQLTISGASLSQLLLDVGLGSFASEGSITSDLQLSGIAGIPSSMEGKGTLLCTNAVIQPADFLRQIGQILSIQELQMLHLSEGKALFRIHQGQALIDELTLHSENLILTAQGPVSDQGNLDLKARLLFNQTLAGRLKGLLGSQLTQAPEAGYGQIVFHVTGTTQNPKTDLLERLTGIHIGGDLGGFLQGIFGHH